VVRAIVETVREGSVRDVSPRDVPNASSNVIASSVAIWFRLGGPNLTVCSGATSGLDAIWLASLLLRGGRADRVVVVGAEPDDEVATKLHRRRAAAPGAGLRAGAACVILESAQAALPGTPLLGPIHCNADPKAVDDQSPSVIIGPVWAAPSDVSIVDLDKDVGDTYGAAGVLQVAVAAGLIASAPPQRGIRIHCGDRVDGWRTTTMEVRA
jgi:3-oxoacyl-(acyl-carrier-protein) synthase